MSTHPRKSIATWQRMVADRDAKIKTLQQRRNDGQARLKQTIATRDARIDALEDALREEKERARRLANSLRRHKEFHATAEDMQRALRVVGELASHIQDAVEVPQV